MANKRKLFGFVWFVITALLLLWLWGRVSLLSEGNFTQRQSQQKLHIRATAAPLRASVFTLSFFTRAGKGILSLWWIAVGITAVKNTRLFHPLFSPLGTSALIGAVTEASRHPQHSFLSSVSLTKDISATASHPGWKCTIRPQRLWYLSCSHIGPIAAVHPSWLSSPPGGHFGSDMTKYSLKCWKNSSCSCWLSWCRSFAEERRWKSFGPRHYDWSNFFSKNKHSLTSASSSSSQTLYTRPESVQLLCSVCMTCDSSMRQ